jgi:hypothetical protein
MTHITDKDLKSMGYREMKGGIWGKPVGFCLLVVKKNEDDQWEISGYFKGIIDNLCVYDSHHFDCIDSLKCSEVDCLCKTYNESSFEFVTQKELFEDKL